MPALRGVVRPPDMMSGAGGMDQGRGKVNPSSPPQPPLRSAVQQSQDNATAFLGPSGLQQSAVPSSEAGAQGAIIRTIANLVQDLRDYAALAPGAVPPEITAWAEQQIQQAPVLMQQLSSGSPSMSMLAAGAGAMGGMQPPAAPSGPARPPNNYFM